MARILMVASEAAPFAKTGGLADVVGSLPRALASLGESVAVLIPRYRQVDIKDLQRVYDHLPIWIHGHDYTTMLYRATVDSCPFYFLDCPVLYDREELYGTR